MHTLLVGMQSVDIIGINNAVTFLDVLEHSIIPIMRAYPDVNSVLVLDNASVHDREAIYGMVNAIGAVVLFLPPYSYDFNPIELAFKSSKDYLHRVYGNDMANNPLGDKLYEALTSNLYPCR